MGCPLLPPGGFAQVSVQVLFDLGLSPAVRDTYTALRVLAWGATETPELSWELIIQYTGKQRKTVYNHMLALAHKGVLSWRPVRAGTIIVAFQDGIGGAAGPGRAGSRIRDRPIEGGRRRFAADSAPPPALVSKGVSKIGRRLSDREREALLDAGVFPAKLGEIEAAGVPESEIAGHLADGMEGGLLVYRLLNRVRPRSRVIKLGERCPECGRWGGHGDECRRRYVSGEFAEYLYRGE